MKQFMSFLLTLFFLQGHLSAQNNAFVLIDVSGNPRSLDSSERVTAQMRREAEELVKQLIQGQYDASRFQPNWKLSGNTDPRIENIVNGNGQPLIEPGGHLLMMPFGAKGTYTQFKINKIQNYPSDFTNYWRTPTSYGDQNTFGEIAKAKAADVAIDANLSSYYLIVISGLGEDTDSNTNIYTPTEIEYMDNYKSAVIQNSLAIFRYQDLNRDFKIEVSHMDLKKMRGSSSNTAGRTQIIKTDNVDKKSLEIVTPKGVRESPFGLENERLLVSWTCLGCEDSTEYVIRVTNLDDRKNAQVKKVSGRLNHSFNLEGDGLYQVSVSGDSGLSDRQFFELKTGGGKGFLTLLILLVLGGVGYFVFKQLKTKPANTTSTSGDPENDLFPSSEKTNNNTLPTTGGDSQNSDKGGYF